MAKQTEPTPRRTPEPRKRVRDPQRTQRRILDAATKEFAAHGFGGARVAAIAQRAGVNQQLISYYFGGKQGLYDALLREWHDAEADLAADGLTAADVVGNYLRATVERPEWARLLLRQGLDPSGGAPRWEPGPRDPVEDLRERQRAGEVRDDVDPEFLFVILMAAALVPVALPHVVRRVFGADPRSKRFVDAYLPQLERLIAVDGPG